jgi:hypothetical protein
MLPCLLLLLAEALIVGAALSFVTTGYGGRPLAIVALFGTFFVAIVFVALSNYMILGSSPFGWLRVVVVLLTLAGCAVTLFPIWDVLSRTAGR